MNKDGNLIAGTVFGATCLAFLMFLIFMSNAEDRKELIRQTYVCLELDPVIPGRCLLAVHKQYQCWRFEVTPNQADSKVQYDRGECVVISR